MAQAGFTPIQLYFSSTASSAPISGNLTNGELAINITDGSCSTRTTSGPFRSLAPRAVLDLPPIRRFCTTPAGWLLDLPIFCLTELHLLRLDWLALTTGRSGRPLQAPGRLRRSQQAQRSAGLDLATTLRLLRQSAGRHLLQARSRRSRRSLPQRKTQ